MNEDLRFAAWCLFVGVLLVSVSASRHWIAKLPLSASIMYLLAGFVLGPASLDLLSVDVVDTAPWLERLSEVAVLVSLFVAGFKLGQPTQNDRWRVPIRLASVSMVATVAMIALAGFFLLGLPLGAAVLLGAILAPTDPVLASDVQLAHPGDRDRLRFGLTGEGALNDGSAFPFVMLGLGLMGLHDLGSGGARWWAVDVFWAVIAGLVVGFVLGRATGRLVVWLGRKPRDSPLSNEFIALGLVALAYGAALLVHAYGFLAVFAAGFALRQVGHAPDARGVPATPEGATPQAALSSVQHFNEQIERFAEMAIVLVIGALAGAVAWRAEVLWFVPLVFLVVRPLAVVAGTLGTGTSRTRMALMSWFGIRGAGSIYYLMFAITNGVTGALAERLAGLALAVVVASIVLHGISVTPLMAWYENRSRR
ncbi:MAG TPA: sodium:proton antiporter [Casimicrobiaceae bacterium]|nr:sodium:proton antiporter [Casimicrobiaceae bacterium]